MAGCCRQRSLLDAVLENGARLAEPGEFTRRASSTGASIWPSGSGCGFDPFATELALRAQNEQLAGKLSQRINELRDELIKPLRISRPILISPTKTSRLIPGRNS